MTSAELRRTLAIANEFKEGDLRIGGTADARLRSDARRVLTDLGVRDMARAVLVEDGVSEVLARAIDPDAAEEVASLTIGRLKAALLGPTTAQWIRKYRSGLTSETIAAVVKIMSDAELGAVARAIFNPMPGPGVTLGGPHHLGSRIQPNSPGDDDREILFSVLEGLTYGCGDVIIGLNPASDDVETIVHLETLLEQIVDRLELPTRFAVLSDIVKQSAARARTRVDVGFQSLAGTSRALEGMVGLDADGLLDLARGFGGLYFETGQGSAVTMGTAEDVDMVTLEARAYGLARHLQQRTGAWTIVNDVAGFIGPEVFRTAQQLVRACLEDVVMAKLHGLTMGLDVCSTFHMGISPAELRAVTEQIANQAAPAYLMAVAGNADPMLGYLTTSFREHPRARRRTGRNISTLMRARLTQLGILNAAGDPAADIRSTGHLYALYQKAGADERSLETLTVEAATVLDDLRQRGFDLGYGCNVDFEAPPEVITRLDAIYVHARTSLFATLHGPSIDAACPKHLRLETNAIDRDDYLAHPEAGETVRADEVGRLLRHGLRAAVQIVVSDGLNANAVNENLPATLEPLRHRLAIDGVNVADVDIVLTNGRVRAGYHVGTLLDPDIVIHLIGERPGTGLNTLSAYVTYGRDRSGASRWRPDLDHSWTTAVCGIHRNGKAPPRAAAEIAGGVQRMFEHRCSGVALARHDPRSS